MKLLSLALVLGAALSVSASSLAASAHALSGTFKIRNVATGQHMTVTGRNIKPRGSGTPISIKAGSGRKVALSVFGKKYCISAQWGGNFDDSGVLYSCAIFGTGTATLERSKQWWYLVPAGSASSSKKKIKREHHRRMDADNEQHALGKRDHILLKRAVAYYIVPSDHYTDMPPRALTSTSRRTGIYIDSFRSGDKAQQWVLE